MKVLIVGGGFVGVTTAVVLAEQEHVVSLVESDPEKVAQLNAGYIPFYEPGLSDAVGEHISNGKLKVHATTTEAPHADVVILCVGTPQGEGGSADLTFLKLATLQVAKRFAKAPGQVVVAVKSTVPPGTSRDVVGPILASTGDLGERFGLAALPEFLREGSALDDARNPERVVIGAEDTISRERLTHLFGRSDRVIHTDATTAEMIKYVSNAMLATRIAFSNEVANLCETLDMDVDQVMHGVGLDSRIGPQFLRAGCGFGGSCFPKDLRALRHIADERGVKLRVLDAVLQNNDTQPIRVVDLVQDLLGDLKGRRVALLGLAFKAHTSDVRETRALPILRALLRAGADVVCHDPMAGEAFASLAPDANVVSDVHDALEGADACIIHTEWPLYQELQPMAFKRMKTPVVVDARRWVDAERLTGEGITVRALGRGCPAEVPG